jgi:hypothetical protein
LRKESIALNPDLLDQWLVRIFSAKCIDLKIKPSMQRRDRFLNTIKTGSKSDLMSFTQFGLGPLAAATVAAMMLDLQSTEHFHTLDLSGNMLCDAGSVAIAEMLANHHRYLEECVLLLGMCSLTNIAEMLANCHSLTHLDLRSNNIGVEGGIALFEAVMENTTLTDLDLGLLAGGMRNRVGLKVCK